MPTRHGKRRTKRLLSAKEFAEQHGFTAARARQLIEQERIWPKPRKVGGSWTIDENAIILRPPERQRFQRIYDKLQEGIHTQKDVDDFVAEARYWLERGIGEVDR